MRSKHMKTNKLLATIAFAFAAAFAARGSTGDIVDIRAVDTDTMKFGSRNTGSAELCSPSNPLVSGEDLYIRVRMAVTNYYQASRGVEEPKTWYFADGALSGSSLYRPKLGLRIGDRTVYAELSDFGPYTWQKSGELRTDDAGNPNLGFRYFTDFYFVYTVQPGDLGLPVKLANSSGTGDADSTDTDSEYCLLNCSSDGSSYYVLRNSDGDVAKFWYGSELFDPDLWPTGVPGDGPIRNYDLFAEGACVKTIDFDNINASGESYSDGDIWRNVYPGMSTAPGVAPQLVVRGGALTRQTTVYVWSADESIVVPAASGPNTVSVEGGKTILTIPIPAGSESFAPLEMGRATFVQLSTI